MLLRTFTILYMCDILWATYRPKGHSQPWMNIHQALLMYSAEEILALSPTSETAIRAPQKRSSRHLSHGQNTHDTNSHPSNILVINILAINARSHMAQKLPNLCNFVPQKISQIQIVAKWLHTCSCGNFDLGDSREDCGVAWVVIYEGLPEDSVYTS